VSAEAGSAPSSEPVRLGLAAVLGVLLAMLVLALQFPAAVRVQQPWGWPGLPAELVFPGLFHEDDAPQRTWLADERPPAQVHLPLAALRDTDADDHESRTDSVTVGFLPLLLAGLGLWAGRGGWAIAGRFALTVALFTPVTSEYLPHLPVDDPGSFAARLLVVALAILAGAGLARLGPRATDGADERPALLLGTIAVLAAGALMLLALSAGAASDQAVAAPLLDRVDASRPEDVPLLHDPFIVAANAAWLRAVLDRAALAAFVGMSALLLHLRSRGWLTGTLLLLAVAADLASVRLLL
jgi:hypothetical protein